MNRLALMLAAGLAHWCVAPGARAQEAVADPVVEQVRAAWQERQRGYDSFIVEWEETGQSSRMIRDQGRQEVTETLTHRLTGDGGKLHYSRSGMQWDMSQLDVIEQEFVRVFDGDERRELWRRGRGEEHPAGFVNNSGLVFDELSFHVEPVLITFSPLNKRMTGIGFTDWRSADRRGSVADVPCLVLERGRGKDVTEVIWVADEAGFRPCDTN